MQFPGGIVNTVPTQRHHGKLLPARIELRRRECQAHFPTPGSAAGRAQSRGKGDMVMNSSDKFMHEADAKPMEKTNSAV
jgi:hypothetical protein